uniref:Uncharacterized protein LOC113792540 n=1 Tax=Dermatophagoides pteronyssinus TaxID=6956 RepID=A0A6P6XZD6_DERPT|nr:uncharacterized protein LOC113792540 [Dermatophagoides pteronyssinus]
MQQCFLSTNFYILRIEYSMNEYKNQRIPWKDRIFKRTVWITAICWVNLLFWIAIIKWPNDIFPLTFNDIDQMTAIHGSNLFSFASIFTFSTLEYVWFSTFFPLLLNYDLRANDLLIKYGKFSHYHLSKNVGQKFYKLVTIKLSSKFKHIFRHRNQRKLFINNGRLYFRYFQLLNIYNISFIISLITMFCTTTAIYSRLSNLPLYNQQCCNFLFEWNARIQSICSIAMIKRKVKRYYLLHERQTIKINLFIQTMTDNRFGFTCGQIFFITKYKYSELIMLSIVLILLFYKKIFLNLDLKS